MGEPRCCTPQLYGPVRARETEQEPDGVGWLDTVECGPVVLLALPFCYRYEINSSRDAMPGRRPGTRRELRRSESVAEGIRHVVGEGQVLT